MVDILVVDFETFYDRDFSLSKMTTEEYLRDELFEVIGVAVKRNEEETLWYSGPMRDTKKWLAQWDWASSIAVAHNAMFDMAILNWHFDIRPKRIADTMSMSRAKFGPDAGHSLAKLAERLDIGQKGNEVINALGKGRLDFTPEELARYGEYCINDVDLTYAAFMDLAQGFPPVEFRVIDLTMRMFTEPVLTLDAGILSRHLTEVKDKKAKLLSTALVDKDVLMSNLKLADLLRSCEVEPPMKISPTTGKQTYAFGKNDEAFKALLEHESFNVQAIVAARMGVKSTLEETRTERFLKIAERGTLPVPLRYYAAHTGRFGGDDKVNLQNLPRKSPLKSAIRAPDGYVVIDCDSSQIEARTLAWLAGQEDLVQAFANDDDVYKIMASSIYGKEVEEISKDERFVGKTTILGSGYGMGGKKFQAQLKTFGVEMSLTECYRIIDVYRDTYPYIPELWRECDKVLEAMLDFKTTSIGREGVLTVNLMGIRLPNDMYIRYPNLRKDEEREGAFVYDGQRGKAVFPKSIWGGSVVENVCQALARIIIAEQMLMISRRYKVAMTVHDSVVAIAPEDEAEEAQAFVESCMRIRPKWATGLPLNCESKVGVSYGG